MSYQKSYQNAQAYQIDWPPDYVAHLKERARVVTSDALMKHLLENKSVISTVQVVENEFRTDVDKMLYTIDVRIGASQTYTPYIAEMPNYATMLTAPLVSSAIGEIKNRIRRDVKKFMRRLK